MELQCPRVTWTAGADGCKDGWVVVMRDTDSNEIRCRGARALADALSWQEAAAVLCVDMPIASATARPPEAERRRLVATHRSEAVDACT